MKNSRFVRLIVLLAAIITLLVPSAAHADGGIGPELLMTGECAEPVMICVSSPAYKHIAQFGEERTESLNRMLRHLSFTVDVDGKVSETTLAIDQEPVYSLTETTDDTVRRSIYSFDPDTVYELETDQNTADGNGYISFLDRQFFFLNRMLDDFYPLFDRASEAFTELSKISATSLTFRGYGKGVKKILISFADQYVKDHFPGALTTLAATEESRLFIEKLFFAGPQKMVLLYDQDDNLLRINYDGMVGLSDESMRRVSIAWRCVRSGSVKKDNLTLKTPALKGGDRYNINYERQIDLTDPVRHTVAWDLQIDLKADLVKKKILYMADLTCSEQKLNGQVQYTEKQDGVEKKITVTPMMQKENDSDYSGTIEITNNSGKIVLSSVAASVRIASGQKLTFPDHTAVHTVRAADESDLTAADPAADRLNHFLIRKMLTLPAEDLEYFSMDIPEDVWNSLMQSLN